MGHEQPRGTVLGIDNIPLDLPVAGLGSRVLAALIDYLAVALLGALLGFAALGVGTATGRAGLGWLLFAAGFFLLQWGYFAARSIIVSIPVVLLFLYLQKYLVSGLTAGSVKG